MKTVQLPQVRSALIGSYPSHTLVSGGVSEIVGHTRTVGLHRFTGVDEAKPKEQARTAKTAPTAIEAISGKREIH